jgi:hypothetical protein
MTFILTSCGISKTFTYGEFEQVEYKDYRLIIKKDSFEYINDHKPFDLAIYPCCGDRIAFGTWTQDKGSNFLRLTSPWYITSSFLDTNVKESKDDSDSITFIITNPIESHHDKYNEIVRDLMYSIVLETNNVKLDYLYTKKFNENTIRIKRPKETLIKSITLFIEPVNNIGRPINVTRIDTNKYNVKDDNCNKFVVEVPQLTYEFISALRLDNDFVKIISLNKLEWDGKYYKRKE